MCEKDNKFTKSTPCGIHTQLKDGGHYVWHKAQTAILHYTREPAERLTLKPDTGMLTHLPLGDSGTR